MRRLPFWVLLFAGSGDQGLSGLKGYTKKLNRTGRIDFSVFYSTDAFEKENFTENKE